MSSGYEMLSFLKILLLGLIALVLETGPVLATLITASVGGMAPAGASAIDFDNPTPAGVTIASTGADFGIYQGSTSGIAATPFGDISHYYSTGIGTTTISFNRMMGYFGLLWGSVDSYNTVAFYKGTTNLGSFTGSDIIANPTGDQGGQGTYFVGFNVPTQYDSVTLSSTSYAFEFDNVAFAVPEPGTVLIFAAGLLGLGFMRVRHHRTAGAFASPAETIVA
jgi:hypothetical protein